MQGTIVWFNLDKGFGFIRTEEDERLYVALSGFVPEHTPTARVAGREVSFDREAQEGDARAVNVVFPAALDPRRARLRHQRGGTAL
ncbi:MAG: cold shock domain-containing protein [Gaiellaceae bacterium]